MPPLSTPPPGSSVPSAASTPAPDDTLAPAAPVTPAPSDASTPAPPPFTSQSPIPRSAALPAQPQIPTGATPATQPPGSANDEQLADVRPPFLHSNFWTYFWLALLGLAVFALLIWLALNRRGRPVSAKTAYELTLEKLEKARALLNEENPVPYAVSISEAIRSYLGLRFAAPSTRRTTEEFLRQMESDPTTPLAGHRDLLREFLQSCDLVKFARYQPNLGELEQVQQRAYNFVTATKPVEMADHRSRA